MNSYHNLDFTVLRKFFSNRLSVSAGIKNIMNNTNINIYGNASGSVHSSGGGDSPVSYGRLAFFKVSYTLLK